MTIASRLNALGITLPPVAAPAAAYVMYVRTGNTLFISGHIAKKTASPGSVSLGAT